jgi:2-C-methyl-D-erythritol 2,4-cyclodiphosphate synthase
LWQLFSTFVENIEIAMTNFRIGHGYDVHALGEGLRLVLGGVEIPHDKGCIAHSDGDVLVHAICDALLGAAALGDIGKHFPDTSDEFKGIESLILLRRVVELLSKEGYTIGNIDSTIAMQRPKLRPDIDLMRQRIAEAAGVTIEQVSVKATTTERLGFEGEEKGVSATAVVLLTQIKN